MARQRHWKNYGEAGQAVFITTTVLDFVHAFRRELPRAVMAVSIVDRCRRAGAKLHAFVVMTHHVHLLVSLPSNANASEFAKTLKRWTAEDVKPHLTPSEQTEFSQQTGLNRNTFWQRSFRGFVVETDYAFWQKVDYIHDNPVKGELADAPADYPFSSARFFEDSLWTDTDGLPYAPILAHPRALVAGFRASGR